MKAFSARVLTITPIDYFDCVHSQVLLMKILGGWTAYLVAVYVACILKGIKGASTLTFSGHVIAMTLLGGQLNSIVSKRNLKNFKPNENPENCVVGKVQTGV